MDGSKVLQIEEKRGFLNLIYKYGFEFAIMVFVFTYLYPVLNSGFFFDDSFNSLIHGAAVNQDVSIWELIIKDEKYWFEFGRVFPLGSFILLLFNALAYASSASFYYKLYIVLMTLANVWLCGVLVEKISHSKRLKLFVMLVIPLFFQIAFGIFNALYSFHGLLQNVMLFGMLSALFAIYYFEKQKKTYMMLSTFFMACSMLLYEVGFLFIFIIMIIALVKKDRSITGRLKSITPQLIVFTVILMVNVYARLNADVAPYSGVAFHLDDLKTIIITFTKQFSAAIPLTQALLNRVDITGALGIRHFICLLMFILLLYFIVFKTKKTDDPKNMKSNILLILIGCIFVIIPCVLISLSLRYQTRDVYFGGGHLPAYTEWFGMALVATGLFSIISEKIRKKLVIYLLCALIGIPILIININTMNLFFISMKPPTVAAREAYVNAIKTGFYDEIDESGLLVYDNSPQYYALPNGDFFATYADRKIAAEDVNTYIETLQPDAIELTELNNSDKIGTILTKEIYYDASGGIILKGDLDGIRVDAQDGTKTKILLSDVQLYVDMPNEPKIMTVHYNDYIDDKQYKSKAFGFDLNDAVKNGRIIVVESDGWIDINSISID